MEELKKKEIFEKSGFRCEKCGYYSPLGKGLEVSKIGNKVLCNICNTFAPQNNENLEKYINEKIDWQILETFRKNFTDAGNKKGMIFKAKQGKVMSRPAFGYKMQGGMLIPAENSDEVREIFEAFANNISMNQIAKQHNLSVNGIKKILKNFTYVGKVKFNGEIMQGKHQPIISSELFNRVQQKFEGKNNF